MSAHYADFLENGLVLSQRSSTERSLKANLFPVCWSCRRRISGRSDANWCGTARRPKLRPLAWV